MLSIMKLNLQNSTDKIKLLTILQFFFVLIAFVGEALVNHYVLNFSFIFQLILLLVAFNFYYLAILHLYYSFWNISLIFGIYYVVAFSRNFLVIGHPLIGVLFLLGLICLMISCYIISSPIYFPQVNWWEYDFRFRADVKCLVEVDGKQFKGRLSDLRRGAACLELFHSIPVGHKVMINIEILNQNFTLDAEVRSKREPIIGRTMIYGVKFINNDLEQSQRMKLLTNYWNESKNVKIRDKFASIGK
jgi:hypothetical protein